MTIIPTRAHPDVVEMEADFEVLLHAAREDLAALLPVLDVCLEVQYDKSRRPQHAVHERKVQGSYSDPTAEAALDGARLRIRRTLARSERDLTAAVISLRGIRRGLEMALANVREEAGPPMP